MLTITERYKQSLESGRLRREGRHPQQLRDHPAVRRHIVQKIWTRQYQRHVERATALSMSTNPDLAARGYRALNDLMPSRIPGSERTIRDRGGKTRTYVVGRHGEWRRMNAVS